MTKVKLTAESFRYLATKVDLFCIVNEWVARHNLTWAETLHFLELESSSWDNNLKDWYKYKNFDYRKFWMTSVARGNIYETNS